MKTHKCLRCGHEWYPRIPDRPKTCAKCKSPYWDIPKKPKLNGFAKLFGILREPDISVLSKFRKPGWPGGEK